MGTSGSTLVPEIFLKIFLFLSPLATLRLALSFPKKNFKKTPGTRVNQELLLEGEAKIDQPTETVLHSNLNSSHYLS